MKSFILVFLSVVIIGLFSDSALSKRRPKTVAKSSTYTGYIVDKMCSGAMVNSDGAYVKASAHDKACLIEPPCLKSGFGLITPDNQWLPFDKAGDKKASKVALATDKDDHIAVTVKGNVRNGTLYVSQIAESE